MRVLGLLFAQRQMASNSKQYRVGHERVIAALDIQSYAKQAVRSVLRDSVEGAMEQERCPYCVEGLYFKVMTSIERYLICSRCGHMVVPDPTHTCSCAKCQKIATAANS